MRHFSPAQMLDVEPVRQWAMQLNVDAIIGMGTVMPDATAARMRDIAPVWIDLTGDPLAEIQSKAEAYPDESNELLRVHVTRLMEHCLRGGDRFSGVSQAQCHALIGQLGLIGRLNQATAGQQMVYSLPIGAAPVLHKNESAPPIFRGTQCPTDAFVVAWGRVI